MAQLANGRVASQAPGRTGGELLTASQADDDRVISWATRILARSGRLGAYTRITDVCCGEGNLLREIRGWDERVALHGFEVDEGRAELAQTQLTGFDVTITHADVFSRLTSILSDSVVVANPPLVPGEVGFSGGEYNDSFVHRLLRDLAVIGWHGSLVFQAFGYLGLQESFNRWPPLVSTAVDSGWHMHLLASGLRNIHKTSAIATKFAALAAAFPRYSAFDEGFPAACDGRCDGEVAIDQNVVFCRR